MLKKAFNKQFEGIIWKIRPDENGAHLALEIREPDQKKVSFSCINTASGNLVFNDIHLQEPWFCGLEGLAHGHAYLHGYLSETLPGHRGIFACSLENGRINWEDYNLVFSHAVSEGVIAWNYKSEPRRYELINPENGQFVRLFNSVEEMEKETTDLPQPSLQFPEMVNLETEWLRHLPGSTLPGGDVLLKGSLRIISFYTRAGEKKLDHHLYVVDHEKRLVHKDLLDRDILQPALDTFFVIGNQLCYIKRKSEILAYFL